MTDLDNYMNQDEIIFRIFLFACEHKHFWAHGIGKRKGHL